MVKFCPLCQKGGDNKKVIAVQINYEQAVWMCESETCPWPFGYGEFSFIPRIINLDNIIGNTDVQKYKDYSQTSPPDLCLYTPPVTPSGERFGKDLKHDFTGDTYSSAAPNVGQSAFQLNISTTGSQIKIKTENEVVKKEPSTTVQSIFDIDSAAILRNSNQLPVKNSNDAFITHNKIKNISAIKDKNKNQVRNRPLIRSIEVTNVNVLDTKFENDFNLDRGKYNMKVLKKIKVTKKNSIIDKNMFKKTDNYITKAIRNSRRSSLLEKVSIDEQDSSETKLMEDEGMLFNQKAIRNSRRSSLSEKISIDEQDSSETKLMEDEGMLFNGELNEKKIIDTHTSFDKEPDKSEENLDFCEHDYSSKTPLNDSVQCNIEIENTKSADSTSQLMKSLTVESSAASDNSISLQIFDGMFHDYDYMNSSHDLDDDWIKSFLV